MLLFLSCSLTSLLVFAVSSPLFSFSSSSSYFLYCFFFASLLSYLCLFPFLSLSSLFSFLLSFTIAFIYSLLLSAISLLYFLVLLSISFSLFSSPFPPPPPSCPPRDSLLVIRVLLAISRFALFSRAHSRPPGQVRARQCAAGSAICRCRTEGRRRAGGAGRSGGRAEILPRRLALSANAWPSPIPATRGWQRDLSVSLEQDRRRAGGAGRPGGRAEILPRRASPSWSVWPSPTPAMRAGSAICRCRTTRIGDVQRAQGDLAGALTSYRDRLAISRTPGQVRPRQRGLAARSVGVVRAGSATCSVAQGDLAGRADNPTATASPSASAWRRPTPATRAGSAICRCRSRRSATCRWRRATWRAR